MIKNGPFSRKLLVILALIVIVTAIGALYFVYDDMQRQSAHRASVKAAYQEKLVTADSTYAAVQGYPKLSGRNRTDEYQAWITGYGQVLGNFTRVVNDTVTIGNEYQQAYGNGSPDFGWVQENNTRLNGTLASLIENYDQRQADYRAVAAAKEQARLAYETSNKNVTAAYALANASLFAEDYKEYSGLKAYLNACSANLTAYKISAEETIFAGTTYQNYLRGDSAEYENIMAQGIAMTKNAEAFDSRYAALRSKAPVLNVTIGATDFDFSGELGWYEYVTFLVNNTNHPTPVWNVTVHFTLTDHETGIVKSTDDVPVTVYAQLSKYYGAILQIEKGRNYDIDWTISYDY